MIFTNFSSSMKRCIFVTLLLVNSIAIYSQGIVFEQKVWKEVLEKAQQTNKPIFIDVYTSWCGPCKKMSNEVFAMDEVGKIYNSNFICYKIDAEKGEGVEIAKKYEVKSFPTYLFIKPDGDLFFKALGAMSAEQFIEKSTLAIAELNNSKSIEIWEKEYLSRKNDSTFILNYIKKRSATGLSNSQLLEDYLSIIPMNERTSPMVLDIYYDIFERKENSILVNTLTYVTIQENKTLFYRKWGTKSALDHFLFNCILRSLEKAKNTQNKQLLDSVITAFDSIPKNHIPALMPVHRDELYINYYGKTGELDQYFKYANMYCKNYLMTLSNETIKEKDKVNLQIFESTKKYLKDKDSTEIAKIQYYFTNMERIRVSQSLMNLAWSVCQKSTEKEQILTAFSWSKHALELMPDNPGCMNIYACLLYKLGDKKMQSKKKKMH